MNNILEDYEDLKFVVEEMDDSDLEDALEGILRIIAKPDITPKTAAHLVVQLQAIATKYGVLKVHYMYAGKSQQDKYRKNMYYSLVERLDKMVDALKYVARV